MTILEQRFMELSIRRLQAQERAEQETLDLLRSINEKLDILLNPDKQ